MNIGFRYWQSHQGKHYPLHHIEESIRRHYPTEPSEIRALALETGLPESAVRGALSFYSDLRPHSEEYLVCQGTSCCLAGSKTLMERLSDHSPCRGAYCL